MALTQGFVDRETKPGRYFDRDNLYLQVRSKTSKSWLLRFNRHGWRERWMGLGSWKDFKLDEAREEARLARQLLKKGIDPIEARLAEREAAESDKEESQSFKEAAEEYFAVHESLWRSARHRQQWQTSLVAYAYPALGKRPVKAIEAATINAALAAIWKDIPVTAARVKNRIEKVVEWVKAKKPQPEPKGEQKHHPALDFRDIPAFMSELRAQEGTAVRALEFLALTASRTNETLGTKWREIDLENKIWTVPKERMKANREHRVPLSRSAVEILERLEREGDYVFPGARKGLPLGDAALRDVMKKLRPDYVPHSLRASFKTWAEETTTHPSKVIEFALAHQKKDKVEKSYHRDTLFEKRRPLMDEWERYCTTEPADASTVVVPITQRRSATRE